ncbi:MAG: aminotransferase class V-fold PLP-dependent enzyme [Anaerolineaceae bacterium]|nr:aminotransferase class V-fold PLP-dependent enzyme [Anaerolineaceae bacterium]MCB9101878.1 aminotransferase class V-fold PLP-dependent enzyme [Anaerolineales bacterium]
MLDEWRATEYSRLDAQRQIYLDYTGGGLYATSQLRQHLALLENNVLGNPHSANPTSLAMTDLVEATRHYVLAYFNASPDEYIAIFTANASGALKLVGEAYPFAPGSRYVLTFDNHNSVNGIREFARSKGAEVTYAPLTTPDLRLDQTRLADLLATANPDGHNLFAFPAQSNFSGVKHPLSLVAQAQEQGWDVLLDAAAFVPTNRLDLSQIKPEFVAMSFYKMFGYPTGIGALLGRKPALAKLRRPWFAGGTVNFASVRGEGHYLAQNEAAFEDGTVNYLSIPAVKIGLEHLEKVGVETIGERVRCLTGWLIEQLLTLKHSNGRPMIRLYGPANTDQRGGTVTLNFYDPDERLLDYRRIEELANGEGISLRTGCFCNPGAGEIAEGLTREDMLAGLTDGATMSLPRFVQVIQHRGNKSAGAIRVSVGLATNFADVYRFTQFAAGFRDQTNLNIGQVTFDIESCRVIRDGS